MANPGEKNVSAYVNPKVAEAFSEQVEKRGYLKRKAIEGAIRAFMVIPQDTQVSLMSNTENPEDILIKAFADVGFKDAEFRKKVTAICQELGVLRAEKKSHRRPKSSKS